MLTKNIGLLSILVGGRAGGDGPTEFRRAFDGIVAEHRAARERFGATWPPLEAMKKSGTPQADLDRMQPQPVGGAHPPRLLTRVGFAGTVPPRVNDRRGDFLGGGCHD